MSVVSSLQHDDADVQGCSRTAVTSSTRTQVPRNNPALPSSPQQAKGVGRNLVHGELRVVKRPRPVSCVSGSIS